LFFFYHGDNERLNRNKQRAVLKRDAAANQIKAIYNLGMVASKDTAQVPKFLIALEDLNDC